MGNKPIAIGLHINQSTCVAGSTISGRVYLSITSKPYQARSINLRLTGEESTVIHHTTERQERDRGGNYRGSSTRHHYERDHCIFLDLDLPLTTFPNGIIQPGQYEFPFQFELPADLPGTVSCVNGKSRCDVRYRIMAHAVRSPSSSFGGFLTPNASSKKELFVLGAPGGGSNVQQQDAGPIILPPEVFPVRTCCCFSRGTMTLSSEVDSGVLSPRDNFDVRFSCKNESTVDVTSVRVALHEVVEWRANGRRERTQRVICERKMNGQDMLELKRLDHLPSRWERHRRQHQQGEYVGAPLEDPMLQEQRQRQENQPQRSTSLAIPGNVRDTYHGNLIEVRHTLTVTLVTANGCVTTNPESCIIVGVTRPGRRSGEYGVDGDNVPMVVPSAPPLENELGENTTIPEAELILPEDWSAQTAEVVSLPLAHAVVIGPANPTPSAPPLE